MITINIPTDQPSDRQLQQLSDAIDNGQLIIIPTDSIYAICCDALNPKAIERLCRIKNINPDKTNLSIICHDIAQAAEYARIDNKSFKILKQYTPGPFTFLLPSASSLPKVFKGRKTVGIRIPDANIPLRLVKLLNKPLLTTSVDFDDDDYAISPSLIAENYKNQVDLMIEGRDGDTTPSTIVDLRSATPEIKRQGKGIL